MATELEELIGFLSSPSSQVRKAAVEIVWGLIGSDEGLRRLAAAGDRALPQIARILRDRPDFAAPAAEALFNLSQDATLAEKLVGLGAVPAVMDTLYKPGCDTKLARLLVMLLANLTQSESGAAALLQVGDDKLEGLYVAKLIRSFCRSPSDESKAEDTFEYVGSILVNISKTEGGRKILLEPKRGLLKQVIRQFDSTNPQRKKGVSGTIRNYCFEAHSQLQNLLLTSEFLWPALLLPVASNKVYSPQDTSKMPHELGNALSHERESVDDPEIRRQALEAIYLIAVQVE